MQVDRAAEIARAVEAMGTWDHGRPRAPLDSVERLAAATREDGTAREALEVALARLLESAAATVAAKGRACRILWRIGTDRSVPALGKLLLGEETAEMAALALLPNRSAAAGRAARDGLAAPAGRALRAAVDLCGERRDPEAAGALAGLAAGTDPAIALAAIGALGKVGGTRAGDALSAILGGPDIRRREAAAHALLRWAREAEARGSAGEAASVHAKLDRPDAPAAVRRGARLAAERLRGR